MNQAETMLVVGEGGREQAFADYLSRSLDVGEVLVAPGNPGTEDLAASAAIPMSNVDIRGGGVGGVMDIVKEKNVDRVVVGPESWLAMGLGNALVEKNIPAIAPPENRAILEVSKADARLMCRTWGVPQPDFHAYTDTKKAIEFIRDGWSADTGVVKASGEAKGKGVKVCATKKEMIEAVTSVKRDFGTAADTILIEERLYGPEVSYIVISDGVHFYALPPAMDFKRLADGDLGPNTGGMGSIAPNPYVTPEMARELEEKMVVPILTGMRDAGKPYQGILYVSAMLTENGPKLIEINCRGGDSETQAQLPLVPYDIHELFRRSSDGSLDQLGNKTRHVLKASGIVVLAAPGYPEHPQKGAVIYGLDIPHTNVVVYQAGTKRENEDVVVNGGRVLNVGATGNSFIEINERIYRAIGPKGIGFDGMEYRRDIVMH